MSLNLRSTGLITAVLAVAATGAQVVLASDQAPTRSASTAASSDPADDFRVLRRSMSAADRASAATETLARTEHADAATSRRATLPPGSPAIRVLPGPEDVCLLVETAGTGATAAYGCAPHKHAGREGLSLIMSGGPSQGDLTYTVGVVPDRVQRVRTRRNGEPAQELALHEGFYVSQGPAPDAIVLSSSDGDQAIEINRPPKQRQ